MHEYSSNSVSTLLSPIQTKKVINIQKIRKNLLPHFLSMNPYTCTLLSQKSLDIEMSS